jgi:sarcosine oxidase, subunit gamma
MLDSMITASRRFPLTADGERAPDVVSGRVTLRELPPRAQFKLRVREEDVARVPVAAGFRFDLPINSFVGTGERVSARLGPNEWLLTAPEQDGESIPRDLGEAFGSVFHVLVDIGHRHIALQLEGPEAANILNAGCALDLDAKRFPTGSATRTLLGKAEIILLRERDTPSYRIECWRSFARYVHAFILEAARDVL